MKPRQIEFWSITFFCIVILFFILASISGNQALGQYERVCDEFTNEGMSCNFFFNFMLPRILPVVFYYIGFCVIMFYLFPRYYEQQNFNRFIAATALVVLVFGALSIFIFFLERPLSYKTDKMEAVVRITFRALKSAILFATIIALYIAVRQLVIPKLSDKKSLTPKTILLLSHLRSFAIVLGAMILFTFISPQDDKVPAIIITFGVAPLAFIHHAFIFFILAPTVDKHQWRWWKYVPALLLVSFFMALAFGFIFEMIFRLDHSLEIILSCWAMVIIVFVSILSLLLYRHYKKQNQTLFSLTTALNTSSANLDFLRSQINPHFLFNALNTLYGLAINEKSENTATGIQKLGDMMRFMLHENNMERIALSREVQYLHNYIDLQRLRIQSSDNIQIDVNLDDKPYTHEIAPMILIPFVENAFKHGISLRNHSWIKVSLSCTKNMLYFDVSNSIHCQEENDPEKNNSGVGLDNVKQRLTLLYPDRHELTIHKSAKEYFVHLTIVLSNNGSN